MIKVFLTKNLLLILIICLGAFLRLYNLEFQSIWDDEIVTMIESDPTLSLRDAYHIYKDMDNMPPLYFIILRILFKLFGYTSLILRGFSAFLGIASLWAIYKLGKELINKNAGLFAAALLSVNYFHLFYSQEGRPYSFLVLFTILSFYFLVLFLKKQTYKNLFFYSCFTSLMLYGQYLAIATFMGQIAILFYFILIAKGSKKTLFLKTVLASLLILISHLPSIPQFIKNSKIKSSWIEAPKGNEYTTYINQFFGNSEMIMPIVYLLIIIYFIHLSLEKKNEDVLIPNPKFESSQLSFIVVLPWLFFGFFIPLLSSYISLPILVPRYFNALIPAIILIAAIGLTQFKNILVSVGIVVVLIIVSLNDVLIVKNYYNALTKAQYKETAAFINKHKKTKDLIVAKVGFHYGHFFKDNIDNGTFIWNNFDRHVSAIISDTALQKPFWYASVHEGRFELDSKSLATFNGIYYINKKAEFFNTSAYLFERIPKDWIKVNLNNNESVNPINSALSLDGSSKLFSSPLSLKKGNYQLIVSAESMPINPVNTINAHLTFKLNGISIAGLFLNEKHYNTYRVQFYLSVDSNSPLEIDFDNDIILENEDRNVSLVSIFIEPS